MITKVRTNTGTALFGTTEKDFEEVKKTYGITSMKLEGDVGLSFSFGERKLPPIVNIVYDKNRTIVFWGDGTATRVTATDDELGITNEHGVAMCITRKLFPNRSEFMRTVQNGYEIE